MATISQVQSDSDGLFYALKKPKQTDSKSLHDFYRELDLTSACEHENIIGVYPEHSSEGTDASEHYLLMDWFEGGDLFSLFKRPGYSEKEPLPAREVGGYILQLLSALKTVHAKGIVHCDVRPHNVLVNESGSIRLIDFGIARWKKEIGSKNFPVVGGKLFISPEHGTPSALCPASDLYCVGLILYFLTTLAFPVKYQGLSNRNTLTLSRLLQQQAPQDPSALNPELSAELSAVILKSIQPNPKDRYQSAREFSDALEESLRATSVHAEKPRHAQTHAAHKAAKEFRVAKEDMGLDEDRMMLMWFGAGAFLVLVLLVLVVLLAGQRGNRQQISPRSPPGNDQPVPPQDPFAKVLSHVEIAGRAVDNKDWDAARSHALKGSDELRKIPPHIAQHPNGKSLAHWIDQYLKDAFYGKFSDLMATANSHKLAQRYDSAIKCYEEAIALRMQYQRDCPLNRLPDTVKTDPENFITSCWKAKITKTDSVVELEVMERDIPSSVRSAFNRKLGSLRAKIAAEAQAVATAEAARETPPISTTSKPSELQRLSEEIKSADSGDELEDILDELNDIEESERSDPLWENGVKTCYRKMVLLLKQEVMSASWSDLEEYAGQFSEEDLQEMQIFFDAGISEQTIRNDLTSALQSRAYVLMENAADEACDEMTGITDPLKLKLCHQAFQAHYGRYSSLCGVGVERFERQVQNAFDQKSTVLARQKEEQERLAKQQEEREKLARAQKEVESRQARAENDARQERVQAAERELQAIRRQVNNAVSGGKFLTEKAVSTVSRNVDRVLEKYDDVRGDVWSAGAELKSYARSKKAPERTAPYIAP